jgi:hypothetical protein
VDSATGVVTSDGLNNRVFELRIDQPTSSNYWDIDDMYLANSSGSGVTDVVGDVYVERLLPDGAGDSTQFTPSAGSNFQNVDDATPDDDTTYNASSTAGHKDLFTVGDLTQPVDTVYGVQVCNYAKKDNPGVALNTVVKSGASESTDAVGATLDNYQFNTSIFETNPDGGGAWTESSVNSMQIGYEIPT